VRAYIVGRAIWSRTHTETLAPACTEHASIQVAGTRRCDQIAVLKETRAGEKRVALVPSVADKLVKLGAAVFMQAGAGDASRMPDSAFGNVTLVASAGELVPDADIVLAVQPPPSTPCGDADGCHPHLLRPCRREPELVAVLVERRLTCFAMERVPRIPRAQAMDALSSQAALAGYYAGLLGATTSPHPARMTTAVGALRPATVLVMGLGVAGLQPSHGASAGRRRGRLRRETGDREHACRSARSSSIRGSMPAAPRYARELTEPEKAKVAEVLTSHISRADLIITRPPCPGERRPTHRQVTGRGHEGGCRHRRPGCRKRRQLRADAPGRPRRWAR